MGILWGTLAGFMSTLIQVGTPPYQIHVLPQRLDKLTLVGTTVISFALMNLMKIVRYFALGQFSPRNLATSVALLPLVVSTFLGIWLVHKTPTEQFYRIAYLLMLLISLTLLLGPPFALSKRLSQASGRRKRITTSVKDRIAGA